MEYFHCTVQVNRYSSTRVEAEDLITVRGNAKSQAENALFCCQVTQIMQ